jgi:putative ABC transport system permease protein
MEIRPILSTLARHKMAAALIVLEIALSCAIICNALFIVSQRLETLNLASGIDDDRLIEIALSGIGQQTDADARSAEDLATLRAIPGVERAAITNQLPFQNGSWNTSLSLTPEQEVPTLNATQYMVSEGALATMGLKLVAGRDFSADEYKSNDALREIEDVSGMSSAIIVSKPAADAMFPQGGAVGKTVYMANIPLTIVGVVDTLLRPNMQSNNRTFSVIFPIRMNFSNGGRYLVRVADPSRRAEVLEQALAALDKNDPNRLVWRKLTFEEGRAKYFANDRDMIGLLLIVSGLLLLVTALGIVGLASFWVQQRTKQIGIRRALGATKGQILRYFLTENFLLATIGIVIGMLLAYLLSQLAVFGPARRAAAIPPAVATRST